MADLIQIDTDEEMDKYAEADLIARNPPPVGAVKEKTLNYNPTTGRNDVLISLSAGGYVKIGDEELSRTEQVKKYSRELESIGVPFDMADYEAADFTADEVQAAGVMPVTQEKTGRTEPLREGEVLRTMREGSPIAAPRATTARDRVRDIAYAGLGLAIDDPDDLRFWSNYVTEVADFAPIVGGVITTDEGARLFNQSIQEMGKQGLTKNNVVGALLGIGLTTLGVAEMVPFVKNLTGPVRKALSENVPPVVRNKLADTIGASRAIAQGDRDKLLEIFQPAGTPRSLSAAAPDTSYRMEHQPTGPADGEGIRLDDLTKNLSGEQAGYPEDFYTSRGPSLYAQGPSFPDDEFGMANQESYKVITSVRNNPDAEVTIYRAVPDEDTITTINPGDFVTLSRKYAEIHGASGYGRSGDEPGKILEQKVKVRDIYWDGDDVNEFGYFPENATSTQSSSNTSILEMNLKSTPRLAELFERAEITVDSPIEEIASTLRRAGRSDIIDKRTAETLINSMKGEE